MLDEITKYVFRPGTFAVAVAVVIITFFIKKIVETAWPKMKKQAHEMDDKSMYLSKVALWWNEVVLYAIPVVAGGCFGFSKSEFLSGDIDTVGARVMFQAGVGWFSAFLYKILRKVIQQKTGVDIQPNTSTPPPSPPADTAG